jgi:hypothetical protein
VAVRDLRRPVLGDSSRPSPYFNDFEADAIFTNFDDILVTGIFKFVFNNG